MTAPVDNKDRVASAPPDAAADTSEGLTLVDLLLLLMQSWKLLVFGPLGLGLAALGITYLISPTFTARTVFLPPQQQQSMAAAALASLGAMQGLAGVAAGLRSPAEQYVALMQTTTVSDRIIERFGLDRVYDEEYRIDVRKELARNVRITAGRRDGLISVEVDDENPQRAADMANRYVEELRQMTGTLAITEAQQRRAFFQGQLAKTREKLVEAQQALQSSGFSQGAIKAEPRAAAEGYARLRAETTAAEIRLQSMRRSLTDAAPEVQQQLEVVSALRRQLARLEASNDQAGDDVYVGRFREFKYHETLFDLFARQYEAARLDESREGALIQVVDPALVPEKKSRPKRALTAVIVTVASFIVLLVAVVGARIALQHQGDPQQSAKWARLRARLARR